MQDSPVHKFPSVLLHLERKGYKLEIPVAQLRMALMEETGEYTEKRIRLLMVRMEELGHIRQGQAGYFINVMAEKQKNIMAQNPEKEAENLLDNIISADD